MPDQGDSGRHRPESDDPIDSMSSEDVESVLDRAGTLAAEAAEQLEAGLGGPAAGSTPRAAEAPDTGEVEASEPESADDLDEQLAGLEELLAQTVEAAEQDTQARTQEAAEQAGADPATDSEPDTDDVDRATADAESGEVAEEDQADAEAVAEAADSDENTEDDRLAGEGAGVSEAAVQDLEALLGASDDASDNAPSDDDAPGQATAQSDDAVATDESADSDEPSEQAPSDDGPAGQESDGADVVEDQELAAQLAELDKLSQTLENAQGEPAGDQETDQPAAAEDDADLDLSDDDDLPSFDDEPAEEAQPAEPEAMPEDLASLPRAVQRHVAVTMLLARCPRLLTPVVRPPVSGLVWLLWALDKPFANVGQWPRQIIGYLALGTAALAAAAFIAAALA